jgi:hypothetical protein
MPATKLPISAKRLMDYVKSLGELRLRTLSQRTPFRVEASEDGLIFRTSSEEPLRHPKKRLQLVCDEFLRTNSLNPQDYKKGSGRPNLSIWANYSIPVIISYLAVIVDGKT